MKEPSFNGLSLTEWLRKYIDIEGRDAGFPDVQTNNNECRKALSVMATNAIPFLLAWIQAADSPIQRQTIDAINRLMPTKHRLLFATDRNQLGVLGFKLIEQKGRPAIPTLIELTKSKNPRIQFEALRCLLEVDAEDQVLTPVIKRCESDPDARIRKYAEALAVVIRFRPKANSTN